MLAAGGKDHENRVVRLGGSEAGSRVKVTEAKPQSCFPFFGCCSSVVEHFLGKEEVKGSSPFSSSSRHLDFRN